MAYTNPDGTAVYINDAGIDSGGFVVAVADDTTNAYAQDLTLLGSGATFSNCTVSSGGVLSLGSGATLSGGVMYAGGSMQINASSRTAATVRDFEFSGGTISGYRYFTVDGGTLYSGARLIASTLYVGTDGKQSAWGNGLLSGLTVKSGAVIRAATGMSFCAVNFESGADIQFGGAVCFSGRANNIAKGVFTATGKETAYASGGILYDYNTKGQATHFRNIVVSNLTISGIAYVSSGVSLYSATVKAKANTVAYASAYLRDYNLPDAQTGAYLRLNQGRGGAMGSATTLAGSNTHIRQGGVQFTNNGSTVVGSNPGMYADKGVIYNMTMISSTTELCRLILRDGISAHAPVINSGASLYLSSAYTDDAIINSRGVLFCFTGARVISATVNYDGALGLGGLAYVYNATVVGDTPETLGNIVISSGTPNPKLAGSETNFASGAVKYGTITSRADWITDPDLYCQNGVLHNLTLISSGN